MSSAAPGKTSKAYTVGLVGERNYQDAVRSCREGEAVKLLHEPDNPYDDGAIAAVSIRGETLGYVPRDCWLRDALLAEGKGCTATIDYIGSDPDDRKRTLGVRLAVKLTGTPIGERGYRPA